MQVPKKDFIIYTIQIIFVRDRTVLEFPNNQGVKVTKEKWPRAWLEAHLAPVMGKGSRVPGEKKTSARFKNANCIVQLCFANESTK